MREPLAALREIARGRAGVLAPGGPGAPLGARAKELLALHAPRITVECDDDAWKAAMERQIAAVPMARERIVDHDASGFTIEFPRGLRFVVQGIVQDSPRHLRASVKALKDGRLHLDTLDLYHARSRIGFARTAACLLAQDPSVVEEHVARLVALAEELLASRRLAAPAVALTEAERVEAMRLLGDPGLLDRVLADLGALG